MNFESNTVNNLCTRLSNDDYLYDTDDQFCPKFLKTISKKSTLTSATDENINNTRLSSTKCSKDEICKNNKLNSDNSSSIYYDDDVIDDLLYNNLGYNNITSLDNTKKKKNVLLNDCLNTKNVYILIQNYENSFYDFLKFIIDLHNSTFLFMHGYKSKFENSIDPIIYDEIETINHCYYVLHNLIKKKLFQLSNLNNFDDFESEDDNLIKYDVKKLIQSTSILNFNITEILNNFFFENSTKSFFFKIVSYYLKVDFILDLIESQDINLKDDFISFVTSPLTFFFSFPSHFKEILNTSNFVLDVNDSIKSDLSKFLFRLNCNLQKIKDFEELKETDSEKNILYAICDFDDFSKVEKIFENEFQEKKIDNINGNDKKNFHLYKDFQNIDLNSPFGYSLHEIYDPHKILNNKDINNSFFPKKNSLSLSFTKNLKNIFFLKNFRLTKLYQYNLRTNFLKSKYKKLKLIKNSIKSYTYGLEKFIQTQLTYIQKWNNFLLQGKNEASNYSSPINFKNRTDKTDESVKTFNDLFLKKIQSFLVFTSNETISLIQSQILDSIDTSLSIFERYKMRVDSCKNYLENDSNFCKSINNSNRFFIEIDDFFNKKIPNLIYCNDLLVFYLIKLLNQIILDWMKELLSQSLVDEYKKKVESNITSDIINISDLVKNNSINKFNPHLDIITHYNKLLDQTKKFFVSYNNNFNESNHNYSHLYNFFDIKNSDSF